MVRVPDGQGNFAEIEDYELVGNGLGSWNKEEIRVPTSWKLRKCSVCLIIFAVLALLSAVACLMFDLFGQDLMMSTTTLMAGCDGHGEISAEQKDNCCKTHFRMCPTTTVRAQYDCDFQRKTWKTAWSESKKDWCCGFSRKACQGEEGPQGAFQTFPFACDEGLWNWEKGWSVNKKKWCCKMFQKGCGSVTHDCDKGLETWNTTWSKDKIEWCCGKDGEGCLQQKSHFRHQAKTIKWDDTGKDFDCKAGAAHWLAGWSVVKRAYCCKHHDIACEVPQSDKCKQVCTYKDWAAPCETRMTWLKEHNQSMAKGEICHWAYTTVMTECGDMCNGCSPYIMGCPTLADEAYDCNHKEETEWSLDKRTFCCENHGKACDGQCGVRIGNTWSEKQKYDCCQEIPDTIGCDSLYDCHVSQKAEWNKLEAKWCCDADARFCGAATTNTTTSTTITIKTTSTAHSSSTATTTTVTTTTVATTTTEPPTTTSSMGLNDIGGPYDCIKDYAEWQTRWTEDKKTWCCWFKARGCDEEG